MENPLAPGSVSRWLARTDGPLDTRLLWQRFGIRLIRLARLHLRNIHDPSYDSEDLAMSTIYAFHRKAADGCFSRPANREQLWNLLAKISLNKSKNIRRSLSRKKRKGALSHEDRSLGQLQQIQDKRVGTPDLVADMGEQFDFLFGLLDKKDPTGNLKTIALMRLDGSSKSQIATTIGCTRFTIVARINLIQAIWREHLAT
jgi:hypothetical protein